MKQARIKPLSQPLSQSEGMEHIFDCSYHQWPEDKDVAGPRQRTLNAGDRLTMRREYTPGEIVLEEVYDNSVLLSWIINQMPLQIDVLDADNVEDSVSDVWMSGLSSDGPRRTVGLEFA